MADYVQSSHGALYREGENVYLRSPSGDKFVEVAAGDAQQLLDQGTYQPATAEEVAARREFNANNTTGAQIAAGAEAVGAGFFDAALAAPKLATAGYSALTGQADPLADVTGRGTLEGGRFLIEEAFGDRSGEMAARQYSEAARARAEANPLTSGAGYILGSVAGSGLSIGAGGLAARGAGALGAGARAANIATMTAEGAIQGAGMASEDAWIHDKQLTAEGILSGAGLGALIGGALGVGVAGAGRGLAAIRNRRAVANVLEESVEAADGTVARQIADDAVAQQEGRKTVKDSLKDALENAQILAAGADDEGAAAIRKMGIQNWTPEGKAARANVLKRDSIIDEASIESAKALDSISVDTREVFDTAVNGALRKEKVAKLISGNSAQQVALAREQMGRIMEALDRTAPKGVAGFADDAVAKAADDFGNAKSRREVYEYVKKQADAMARQDVNGTDAFVLLDEAKRTLAREKEALANAKNMVRSRSDQIRYQNLEKLYEDIELPTRMTLEREEWGAAGAWQKRKNAAWHQWLAQNKRFDDIMTTTIERRSWSGAPVKRADPAKLKAFYGKTGTANGALDDEIVQKHLADTKELAEAIAEGSDEHLEKLAQIKQSFKKLEEQSARAREIIGDANKLQSLRETGQLSGEGLTAAGALIGGAPGAVLGKVAGMATQAHSNIYRLAQLERIAGAIKQKVAGRAAKVMPELATQAESGVQRVAGAKPIGGRIPFDPDNLHRHMQALAPLAKEGTQRTAVQFASADETDAQAFERYQGVLAQNARDPEFLPRAIDERTGLAAVAPKTFGAVVMTARRAMDYLQQHAPKPYTSPELKRLGVSPPKAEIERFKNIYSAISDPMGVLDDLADGVVNPDKLAAVKAVYPLQYAMARDQIMGALATAAVPPPYDRRVTLDMFLDANGAVEPMLSPETLRMRSSYQQRPDNPRPPSRQSAPNVAGNYATLTQRLGT